MEAGEGAAPAKKRRTAKLASPSTYDVNVVAMMSLTSAEDLALLHCRVEHLQQAEGIKTVQCTAENTFTRVKCGPFTLRARGAAEGCIPPALLWSFACLAAELQEEPEITFDETDACINFLRGVLRQLPQEQSSAHAVLNDAINAVEEMVSDSAPLTEEHRAVHLSERVLSAEECARVVQVAEEHATGMGWSTGRHAAYPTTDLSVGTVPSLAQWLPLAIQERLLPEFEIKFALRPQKLLIQDLFVAKYEFKPRDGKEGQVALEAHEDGNAWSFVVPLNPPSEYKGGGTQFVTIEDFPIFRPDEEGCAVMFSGQNTHCGVPIESGLRYILAGFLSLSEEFSQVEGAEEVNDSLQNPDAVKLPECNDLLQ